MQLNCDLGESYGNWIMGRDADVMPYVDQANIACGFHAGDPLTMRRTLALADKHGVSVGAHPAYPDLVGFGRRSMNLEADEIIASLHYQIAALDGMASSQGLQLQYVKPHGALYNDMMAKDTVREAVMQAVQSYHKQLFLMMQATPQADQHRQEATALGLQLQFEAFADRCYDDAGKLLSRSQPGAVLDQADMLDQVTLLVQERKVRTLSGQMIHLQADTLCVHGDHSESVAAIRAIRALVDGN